MRELEIAGAWLHTPRIHRDERGSATEWFSGRSFEADTGIRLEVAQANCPVTRRGAIRGVHYADVPPGQAKYVTCVAGTVLDVVVDVRTGSPTFGQWTSVQLDDLHHKALYLAEGLGHALIALTEQASVVYLCSTPYTPEREHGVHPLDPEIGIDWPTGAPLMLSERDACAPTLREAADAGLLPTYEACRAHTGLLRAKSRAAAAAAL